MIRIKASQINFLILTVLLFFCGCNSKNNGDSGKNSALKKIEVGAIVIQSRELENKILSTGNLIANEEIELRSEVSGRIVAINFDEGSHVNKGDLLLKIDDRELQAQLRKLQVEEKQAKDDVYRKEKLLEMKAVSQEEYDKSFNTLGIIQAQMDLVKIQISKTGIYAPFTGMIGLRQVSPGGFISSSTLVTRLQQLDPVKIDFSIPEKYRAKVGKGTLIKFRVDGIDSVFTGRVYAIDPKIDLGTRNLSMRALCPNHNGLLVPGSFVKVEIVLDHMNDAMVIPSEAIIPQMDGEKVFISKEGKAISRIIHTGIRTEREVQVLDGLTSGDTVIITGILQLREDMPVKIRSSR